MAFLMQRLFFSAVDGVAKTDYEQSRPLLIQNSYILGKTQERAKVVKAQLYATLIWLLDHILYLLLKTQTLRHYQVCYELGRCCRLAHVQSSVQPR
jgi:hypothetical protein